MQFKRFLFRTVFSVCLLELGACQTFRPQEVDYGMNTRVVHISVNDETLSQNDSFALIEPVWWIGNIYGSVDEYEESLARFSKPQRYLFAIHWYITEVNNGGHDQFYFNSTGIVWPDVLAGFDALGLDEAVDIVQESIARMGGRLSQDRGDRQGQLDSLSPDFDDLDDRFYTIEEKVDLNELMMDYARENASSFYFEGEVEIPDFP